MMSFSMTPSDPDFPYEIEKLDCVLSVPQEFPTSKKATLVVTNKEIPRGFQINIEKGFDILARDAPEATLLGLMNRLDKQLEIILAGKMAETVKIVSNRGHVAEERNYQPQTQVTQQSQVSQTGSANALTSLQLENARVKRQSDLRQLEARFGRLDFFTKSADGSTYTLPLDSPKRSSWPSELQSLKSIQLLVPESYPVKPAELKLGSESKVASTVEKAFKVRSQDEPSVTITQQVNYLSQHLKDMAISKPAPSPKEPRIPKVVTATQDSGSKLPPVEEDKSHIHHIPRPPEWDAIATQDESDDSFSEDEESGTENDDEDEDEEPQAQEQSGATAPAERGILLSFPHLELHGIELLELTSLNITVKCERCKELMDIERLRSTAESAKMREESCKKCASGLAVRFRADMIHANSVRGGYLDLDGCTVVDMLPSNFIPTCSDCSTGYPAPGVVAVRGDTALAICRECHKRMTFRIQEVKFLQVSASAVRASRAPGRKKVKENLGITAGTELPRRGRCTHYRKSYRWFRFSCCQRVFACDRCHDEQTDHPNEHANRMIWYVSLVHSSHLETCR